MKIVNETSHAVGTEENVGIYKHFPLSFPILILFRYILNFREMLKK